MTKTSKMIAAALACMLVAGSAFAVTFSPSVMKIAAPSHIQYNFDGTMLNFPVTVSGANSALVFLIYTKDKAESIGKMRNGYLGWHYVNKVDTCLYVSPVQQFPKGTSQTFYWDGKDNRGFAIPKGDYTFYLWGYDNTSQKQLVNIKGNGRARMVLTHDAKGIPLPNPYEIYGSVSKWQIGNDPMDSTLVENTVLVDPFGSGGSAMDKVAFDQTDYTKVFCEWANWNTKACSLVKYNWVSNGSSTIVREWADQGEFKYPVVSDVWVGHGGVLNLNNEKLVVNRTSYHTGGSARAELVVVDMKEGTLETTFDLQDWWSSVEDYNQGGQMNGGPHIVDIMGKYVFLSSSISCHKQMLDPTREDKEDWVVWSNDNGDFYGDHNFEADAKLKWVCNDWNVGPYMYTTAVDANLFSLTNAYDLGAVTFGAFGPDGTGFGYFAFAGETAGWKKGQYLVDYGSAYDGMYTDYEATGGNHMSWDASKITRGTFYIGYDSVKGVLSSQVKVSDAAPAVFSVAQNSPNPFNPSTAIGFTLANAGKVTVDVFNAAGQKVDTIVNSRMAAGSHTVNWNASKFAAGVYFCTVKTGSLSRTVKMTLLK